MAEQQLRMYIWSEKSVEVSYAVSERASEFENIGLELRALLVSPQET